MALLAVTSGYRVQDHLEEESKQSEEPEEMPEQPEQPKLPEQPEETTVSSLDSDESIGFSKIIVPKKVILQALIDVATETNFLAKLIECSAAKHVRECLEAELLKKTKPMPTLATLSSTVTTPKTKLKLRYRHYHDEPKFEDDEDHPLVPLYVRPKDIFRWTKKVKK